MKTNYAGFWTFSENGLYTIRCRIKWATNWYKIYFGNRLLNYTFHQNTEKLGNFQMLKFNVFWFFFLRNYDQKKMPYIQFCRARQALSIGIWLSFFDKQYSRKKLVWSYKSIFDHFWRVFWGWVNSIQRTKAMVILQNVKLWVHLWWTKAQLCSRSNSNSVDPHVHAIRGKGRFSHGPSLKSSVSLANLFRVILILNQSYFYKLL